jgi:hypothetical protein
MNDVHKILSRRDVQRFLARPYTVRWCKLWLTGGVSEDVGTYFLDYDLRDRPQLAARVLYHERVEATVRHLFGWRYLKAHRVATAAERDKFGPEPPTLKAIVARNLQRRPRTLPPGFDRQLAKEAAESVGS